MGEDILLKRLGPAKAGLMRTLMITKMGIEPGTWRKAPPAVASRFASQWEPVEHLAGHLSRLPAGALRYLAEHPRGFLLVETRSQYQPGESTVQGRLRANVAYIDIRDVMDPFPCLSVVASLLDHLLGCAGLPNGLWLSEGGGTSQPLRELGEKIQQLFHLGYGGDEPSRECPRAYLASSFAWYIVDRRRLNIDDPLMERLLKDSLYNWRFWDKI